MKLQQLFLISILILSTSLVFAQNEQIEGSVGTETAGSVGTVEAVPVNPGDEDPTESQSIAINDQDSIIEPQDPTIEPQDPIVEPQDRVIEPVQEPLGSVQEPSNEAQSANGEYSKGLGSSNADNGTDDSDADIPEDLLDDPTADPSCAGNTNYDLSARVHLVKTYGTQEQSPLEQRPTHEELQEGITEYGFSFYFKWDFLWKNDYKYNMATTEDLIEMAYLSATPDSAHRHEEPTDIYLGVWLDLSDSEQPKIVVKNYLSYYGDHSNQVSFNFPSQNYDNEWTFIHASYDQKTLLSTVGVKFQNKDWNIKSLDSRSNLPVSSDNKIYFRIAQTHDEHLQSGWQGFFKEILFTYGQDGKGGSRTTEDELNEYYQELNANYNPYETLKLGTVQLSSELNDSNEMSKQISVKDERIIGATDTGYPIEYAISGWFQADSGDSIGTNNSLLYQVSTKNRAVSGEQIELGQMTFQAEISGSALTFTTYSINQLNAISQNQITFEISQDDYQNDFFVYHGYSRDSKLAIVYVKTYDNTEGELKTHIFDNTNGVIHMRSNDYVVTMAKDKLHSQSFVGEISCLNFTYGEGSFVSTIEQLSDKAKSSISCAQTSQRGTTTEGQKFKLQSYNIPEMFLSHGNPSYLTTNEHNEAASFYVEDGLMGDNNISFRSAMIENENERTDFYWRHSNGIIREQKKNSIDEDFLKDASWIHHPNKFIEGTSAFESANKRGYYLRHDDYSMVLSKFSTDQQFAGDASWHFINQEKQKYVCDSADCAPCDPFNQDCPENCSIISHLQCDPFEDETCNYCNEDTDEGCKWCCPDEASDEVCTQCDPKNPDCKTPPPPKIITKDNTMALKPVFRLFNPVNDNLVLTIRESKVKLLKSLNYQDRNLPDSEQLESDKPVIGYTWPRARDEHSVAIHEFYNQEKDFNFYTASPNSITELDYEGYLYNGIVFYAYQVELYTTVPVKLFKEIIAHNWYCTSSSQKEILQKEDQSQFWMFKAVQFWIYPVAEVPCATDIDMCPPIVLDECLNLSNYRKDQDSACEVCEGEITHYAEDDKTKVDLDKLFTGTCKSCEGGYTEADSGLRTCRTCPKGSWYFPEDLDGVKQEAICHPDCDAFKNQYLDQQTLTCVECVGGELRQDKDLKTQNTCFECDMGVEKNDKGMQVCTVCKEGYQKVKLESGLVCNRVCEGANEYVTADEKCAECKDGFLYDDGTQVMRCAANSVDESDTGITDKEYSYDEEEPYTYQVPADQVDDIKEFAFFMWVRFQYYNPKKFALNQWENESARIGGFNIDDTQNGLQVHLKSYNGDQEQPTLTYSTPTQEADGVYPLRKDFDYSWNLVYMVQGKDSAVAFTYFHESQEKILIELVQPLPLMKTLGFYLQRQQGGKNMANLGFQGTFHGLQLKFGTSGLFMNTAESITSYLLAQNCDYVNAPPMILVHAELVPLFTDAITDIAELADDKKTFKFENLHGTKAYAVYGWVKKDTMDTDQDTNTMLWNLQDIAGDQTGSKWEITKKIGDSSLTSYTNGGNLNFDSYNTTPNGRGSYTSVDGNVSVSLDRKTLDGWMWIYQAYNGRTNESWSYTTTLLTSEDIFMKYEDPSYHFRPQEQVLTVGQWPSDHLQTATHSKLSGQVLNMNIQYENICAYEDKDCLLKIANSSKPLPAPEGQCVIMYNQPEFLGDYNIVCYEDEQFDLDIKSIYIPEGVEFKIWDQKQFDGLTIIYTETQNSVQFVTCQLLLAEKIQGMSVLKNQKYYELMGIKNPNKFLEKTPKIENQNLNQAKETVSGGIKLRSQESKDVEMLQNKKSMEQQNTAQSPIVEQKESIPTQGKTHLRMNRKN